MLIKNEIYHKVNVDKNKKVIYNLLRGDIYDKKTRIFRYSYKI